MTTRALSEGAKGKRQPARRESLLDLVGHTSLVQLTRLTKDISAGVEVWVKLEFMNPGGSIKDRTARQIVEDALANGDLGNKRRLVDAAPENAGVAYAMIGAALDVGVTVVMPADASPVRRRMVERFGADVIESSAEGGITGAIEVARALAAAEPDRFWFANHFDNPSNPRAHELSTAPEIWTQTQGRITHFVCGVGTGGTITGTSRGLRAHKKSLAVYACRPSELVHGLDGLDFAGSGLNPGNYDPALVTKTIVCDSADGMKMAERLALEEGLAAGYASGANVWCALELARELESGVIVTIISDHIDRYIDT